MKKTLTALTVAALLIPLSANAIPLTYDQGEEIMANGEVMGSRIGPPGAYDNEFVIRYKGSVFYCVTSFQSTDYYGLPREKHLRIECYSTESQS